MPVITIFNGIFCNETTVIDDLIESTGFRLITDDIVLQTASELSGIKTEKIKRAFSSKSSVFNPFTNEKERSVAYLKLAVSQLLNASNILLAGYSSLLIPKEIPHVLRICMIANKAFRLETASREKGIDQMTAGQLISDDDQERSSWTESLFSTTDPWEPALYDMVIPMGKTTPDKAAALIKENLLKPALEDTPESAATADEFSVAAHAGVTFANAGHSVGIEFKKGALDICINKKVLMLNRLEEELVAIAREIPGVESVTTRVEQAIQNDHLYWKHSEDNPSRVLLVDDEREFVQTLSERLQMRDVGCVVAFDGESALDLVREDDPEVVLIDLKMPGIDGIEVLTQVKKIRPEIQIIVLTGHGSEQDKEKCMALGAFAYMHKPVDINELSRLLKEAHHQFKSVGQNAT